MQRMNSKLGALAVLSAMLALSGCISLGKKPPDQLLNLTATTAAPAGASASGSAENAIAVMDVEAPQKIDVARVPVDTSGSTVAYLQDAQWVEKPARLFTRLVSDTLRARGNHLVVSGTDLEDAAAIKLSGTLQQANQRAHEGQRSDCVSIGPDRGKIVHC